MIVRVINEVSILSGPNMNFGHIKHSNLVLEFITFLKSEYDKSFKLSFASLMLLTFYFILF